MKMLLMINLSDSFREYCSSIMPQFSPNLLLLSDPLLFFQIVMQIMYLITVSVRYK